MAQSRSLDCIDCGRTMMMMTKRYFASFTSSLVLRLSLWLGLEMYYDVYVMFMKCIPKFGIRDRFTTH